MRELPILFSGAMVRALLDGSKTQTRRVVRKQFGDDAIPAEVPATSPEGWQVSGHSGRWWDDVGGCDADAVNCPFGVPGDRLWVRETWSADFAAHYPHDRFWYAADDDRRNDIEVRDGVRGIYSPESDEHVPFRWHPSIHMPRAASRITLEVTGVRVERLQDISENDAEAEGVDFMRRAPGVGDALTACELFRCLWADVATPEACWPVNPWVWVVEFKRVTSEA